MHNVFYILLLEQDIIRKRRVDEIMTELDIGNDDSRKYEVEAIWDNVIYVRESKSHLSGLYYLVFWKRYLEKENT